MGPTPDKSEMELSKLFDSSRLSGNFKDTVLICIYFPLGIILAVLRLFMLFHIYAMSSVLPVHLPVFRNIIRFMLLLCGLSVKVKSEEHRNNDCPVITCNHISPADRLILYLIQPNILANEWGYPPFLSWLFGMTDLDVEDSRDTFLQNAKRLCQESAVPLFTRPEGSSTSGKRALLKFSTWQFSICDEVQPVVISAKRPMPINLTTLRSTAMSDLFYFIYSPYTLFSVTYLPVIHREEEETVEDFSERVRSKMAYGLGLTASKHSRHDKNDLIKKLNYNQTLCENEGEAVHTRPAPAQRQTSNIVESQPLRPELESMVQSCKAVVPQVPIHVLRKEILKTQDVDATLSNILEGNIDYQPEAESTEPQSPAISCLSRSQSAASNASQVSSTNSVKASTSGTQLQTYAAVQFAKRSDQRHMSLSERKQAMLQEARLRYIEKHQLPITLEQIESGRFS